MGKGGAFFLLYPAEFVLRHARLTFAIGQVPF
jgi:hypothetical protein